MRIHLLRHAIAVDRTPAIRDENRELTEEGAAQMRRGARGMKRLGLRFDSILTSPLIRARQTADIVAEALDCGPPTVTPELGPGFSCEAVCARLAKPGLGVDTLLVGHQPDFEEFASFLLAGNKNLSIPLKKASLCLIEVEGRAAPGRGGLIWLLAPKHLRQLGGE